MQRARRARALRWCNRFICLQAFRQQQRHDRARSTTRQSLTGRVDTVIAHLIIPVQRPAGSKTGTGRESPLELGTSDRRAPPTHPALKIFLARFLLNDLASVGIIPGITVFLAALLLVSLNTMGFSNIGAALIKKHRRAHCTPLALLVKRLLVGNRWGRHNTAPFWSVRHHLLPCSGLFFRLMTGFMSTVSGTALANPILRQFGCRIGWRT